MRILDQNGNEMAGYDPALGYVKIERIVTARHEAVEAAAGEGHHEVIAEYPNGGKDVKWVWDVEPVEAREAFEEYEDVQRYVAYTEEELAQMEAERSKPTQAQRLETLEAAMAALMGGIEDA